jgi:hypothetical protein
VRGGVFGFGGILGRRNEGEEGPWAFTMIVAESGIWVTAKALPVSTWACAEGPE